MKRIFLLTLFASLLVPVFVRAESGMDILNAGFKEGAKMQKRSGSYITIEKAEAACKEKACEAGYCDKAVPCNELKYDIYFSACMRAYRD
jgi:hypothetical protein